MRHALFFWIRLTRKGAKEEDKSKQERKTTSGGKLLGKKDGARRGGAVSDLCLESSLGPFNVSSISVYDKQPCVAGQVKNHASGVQIQLPIPYAYSRMRRHGRVLATSSCHSGEQCDKQVTTAASSPISGFRAFP